MEGFLVSFTFHFFYISHFIFLKIRHFADVVGCLIELHEEGLFFASEIADATTSDATTSEIAGATISPMQSIIQDSEVCSRISNLALKLVEEPYKGQVPNSKSKLLELVTDSVASFMMAEAFHSTDRPFGFHSLTMLTALDLYDWESYAEIKSGIDFSTIPLQDLQKSLNTWVPITIAQDLYYVLESLGRTIPLMDKALIQSTIMTTFSEKDQQFVLDMTDTIHDFYIHFGVQSDDVC